MTTPQGISASTVPVQPSGSTYLFTSTPVYPTLITNLDGTNTAYYGFGNGLTAGDITTTAPLAPGGSIAIQGDLGDVYAVSAPGTVVNVAVVPGGNFFTVPPSVFKAGNAVIINQQGLFVFNGVPHAGNLIFSISATSGTIFGNTFLAGAVTYANDGFGTFIQLNVGIITLGNTAFPRAGQLVIGTGSNDFSISVPTLTGSGLSLHQAGNSGTFNGDLAIAAFNAATGKLTAAGQIIASAGVSLPNHASSPLAFATLFMEELTLSSAEYLTTIGNIGGLAQWYTDINGVILANHPGSSNTPETWQTPTLTGFSPNGTNQPFKYRITPENMLEFEGEMAATGAYVAGTTIFTLPSGYRPPANTNRPITIAVAGGVNASFIAIPAAGTVNIGSAMAAGNVAITDGRVRLVA